MRARPLFIVIDGLDGSGKSTQAKLLIDEIRRRGRVSILRGHPSDDSFFGVRARAYLFLGGRRAHFAATLFYLSDVVRSIVLYEWRRVDYIVFVRYLLGTTYLSPPFHKLGYLLLSRLMPRGKPMIFLRVDPNEAYLRVISGRGRMERFESLEELIKAAAKVEELIAYGGWEVVDGSRSPEDVHEDVLRLAKLL